jgi:hypothetical protein
LLLKIFLFSLRKILFCKNYLLELPVIMEMFFMGYIGSEHLIDYTVLGEAVNITFKLQELAKKLSYPIIITEDVMNFFSPEKDFNNFVIKKFNNIYLKKYNVSFNIFGLKPMNLESKEVTYYGSCSLPSKDNSLR